jgi:hypothetical protein
MISTGPSQYLKLCQDEAINVHVRSVHKSRDEGAHGLDAAALSPLLRSTSRHSAVSAVLMPSIT